MKRRHPHKEKILLVNITRLGDMLQATPTIAGLKLDNPQANITVLVEKQFEDVCHLIPGIDNVISLDLGMTVRSLAREQEGIIDAYEYVDEFVTDLRRRKFDFCLNMSSSGYTALLLKLVGIERNGGWTADEEGHRVIESAWAKLFASSVFHLNRQYNSLNLVDVFRCSADVEQHPKHLVLSVPPEADEYAEGLLREAAFSNAGPIVAIQAGASQLKRQWSTERFVRLIRVLLQDLNARVVLIGSRKEMKTIDPIKAHFAADSNVAVFAGKTSIPQLAAVLRKSSILITGDTGPMHMAVAVGTPVVAIFLASAFGFETGPYSEGNLVLQPVIGCGPCNPNKPCAGLECHDTIDPELVAHLAARRIAGQVTEVSNEIADPRKVIVYRSYFDQYGFCDLQPINSAPYEALRHYREVYRKLWLSELGGFNVPVEVERGGSLQVYRGVQGLERVVESAQRGVQLIAQMMALIRNTQSAPRLLGETNQQLTELDREIEQLGFHHAHLGPLTRMFVFEKENLSGSEALSLASQMGSIYEDLIRRGEKFGAYATASY